MEVLNTNTNNQNHQPWGHHRYSSLSLASAANSEDNYSLAESFHTCYDEPGDQDQQLGRVASFSCLLEEVEEEDHTDLDASAMTLPSALYPLRPLPMNNPPMLTAARLALSSDIGVLRRSRDSTGSMTDSPVKAARVLLERDQIMASSALPMSRSFATPRMTVSTAFRSSTSNSSLNSWKTAEPMDEMLPVFMSVESSQSSKYTPNQRRKHVVLQLEALADDVQIQIISFLPLENVRALMATNRRYRKLLFTKDAQNLWKDWCHPHHWQAQLQGKLLVDDLSLPTAARPKSIAGDLSDWHQQANLSLLLSMAQSQPTQVDEVQLNEYRSHQPLDGRRRRRRTRNRIHTTDGSQPLLQYKYVEDLQQWIVRFTGRVGQGDRCVRSNQPFPRPTLIETGEWMVPPSQLGLDHKNFMSGIKYHPSGAHSLLDLFCRNARAVTPPRPAWRPFVAPFMSPEDEGAVHLTPRFVSYFEVSIMEPQSNATPSATNDCVAVGVATESFDWHSRMPGWDASSFGYHGDDGGIFHSSGGMLRKFGPSYGRGDVVGCGIDHVMRGIFFTLNGEFLGYGWTGLPQEMLERDMYPVVGIDTNDNIHCNFGTEPFQYDLKAMVVKHEELVHQSLSLKSPPMTHSIRSV